MIPKDFFSGVAGEGAGERGVLQEGGEGVDEGRGAGEEEARVLVDDEPFVARDVASQHRGTCTERDRHTGARLSMYRNNETYNYSHSLSLHSFYKHILTQCHGLYDSVGHAL